ncbi:helicase-related protein [Terrihabitans sp. B22-R8]|uniref:helicase-related protein n=1 Tax=Terrihabitans sp. B22-R8 TaxID=3425128 RepID=UPI00403C454A
MDVKTRPMPTNANPPAVRGRGVTAVLGPTNTGKTHLAIERMVAQPSGVIGLPLRLLAREVYQRVVEKVGADKVALITGEEKIKPRNTRFWVSTIEAMPKDIDVDFVAIDEIQLAADLDRGHVFTDRILNMRGRQETLLLGAATMRPLIEHLLPGASILGRPRLSTLTFAGEKKITRLPRRTAIVAFSASEVYAIAELIRRQRGGAAVVLGALSPRTRNAQVELYQSGDVEYLIATDAIGMGLNLDVDHIAFAGDRKFDGFQFRRLNPSEFAQIAGRAGRHMRNGTFGTTGRCDGFEAELVERIESHSFDPVRVLQWRNSELDFRSLARLQASLSVLPQEPGLTKAPTGEDVIVLERAIADPEMRALATDRDAVERLWEVCQVPDYRKVSPAAHAEIAMTIYGFLMRQGRISQDWFARQVAQCDRTDGDIDTLSARIAHIRTWTFVANRADWLFDPTHWQALTRTVEDKLSDALHERLTQRFVDRRSSVLMRRLRDKGMIEAEVDANGDVLVEGQHVGRLSAFRFTADTSSEGPDGKAVRAAAQKALGPEYAKRAERLAAAPDADIVMSSDGVLRWLGEPVGKLVPGDRALHPRARLLADDTLAPPDHERAEGRLQLWIDSQIQKLLGPLRIMEASESLTGLARGLGFQIVEALGVLDRTRVSDDVKTLDQDGRAALRALGVRFGAYHLYLPALLKPAPRQLAAQLWALGQAVPPEGLDEIPALAASGRTSFKADARVPKDLYRVLGYRVCHDRAVRVDILERLADLIRPAIAYRPGLTSGEAPAGAAEGNGFTVTVAMTSLTGCSGDDFANILRSLGYRMERKPAPVAPAEIAVAEPTASAEGTELAADIAEAGGEGAMVEDAPAADADAPVTPEEGAADAAQTEPEAVAPVGEQPAVEAEAEPVAVDSEPDDASVSEGQAAAVETEAVLPVEGGAGTSADPLAQDMNVAAIEAVTGAEEVAGEEVPAAAEPTEPAMIEIWRPGRSEHRRPDQRRDQNRRQEGRGEQPNRGERRGPRPERGAAPAEGRGENGREGRSGKPPRNENWKANRPKGGKDGDPRQARPAQPPRPERRERPADPDSPFAALAALKAQLDGGKRRK